MKTWAGADDTDLTWAVARAYIEGYSIEAVAQNCLQWFAEGPPDVGVTTAAALCRYQQSGDPTSSRRAVAQSYSAGNGSLMRALATGLVRQDAEHLGIRWGSQAIPGHWSERLEYLNTFTKASVRLSQLHG